MSEPTPSPQWFAPDFLIGPSLPFERRATGVAKQPQERQMEGGGPTVAARSPAGRLSFRQPRPLAANAFPFFSSSSSWDFLGPQLQELLVSDLFGLVLHRL